MFLLASFIICCGDEAVPSEVNCSLEDPIFPCVSESTLSVFEEQSDRIGIQNSQFCELSGFNAYGLEQGTYGNIKNK